ncbi:hypothetical protein [Janthinobacterium lividum]|uniref:hypothetical protein n=1 Tax=Janthinobacterium lividum TaxID=29581 RepID=UPI00044E4F02|nr:hypothetical protein [Janthinobacterium lividum]EZP41181.1 hypothetical protein BW37_01130 [Janthinobacterium lividum]
MEKHTETTPLDLRSAAWASLTDGYGGAEKIPAMLQDLRRGDAEALDDLYGHICHQGSIYPASVATFPHLVSLAAVTSPDLRAGVLSLAASIHESAGLDEELKASPYVAAFNAAVPAALAMATSDLRQVEDTVTGIYMLKAAASFAGFADVARVLGGFTNEEFCLACPACGVELYVWPVAQGLSVAAEDPVFTPAAKTLLVIAGPVDNSPHLAAFAWLQAQTDALPLLDDIAFRLPFLFGSACCTGCGHVFSLMDALLSDAVD